MLGTYIHTKMLWHKAHSVSTQAVNTPSGDRNCRLHACDSSPLYSPSTTYYCFGSLAMPDPTDGQDRLLLKYAERVGKNLDVKAVTSGSGDRNELVFDLVGVDASIANALRRILLAEVRLCDKGRTRQRTPSALGVCSDVRMYAWHV